MQNFAWHAQRPAVCPSMLHPGLREGLYPGWCCVRDILVHMCGRFARSSKPDVIIREFGVQKALISPEPSYNIAPSQDVAVIRVIGEKQLVTCRWGFVSSWAKDSETGYKMINARSETVAEKPAFREAILKHRCLVIADGFFEWQRHEKKKMPYYIRLTSGRPFGLAGLCNAWTSPEKEVICTFTVITTNANELLAPVHDRMPVIIPKEKEDLWLDPDMQDKGILCGLLRPYPAVEMEMYPVSPNVNSPGYNVPEALKPVLREGWRKTP